MQQTSPLTVLQSVAARKIGAFPHSAADLHSPPRLLQDKSLAGARIIKMMLQCAILI